MLLVRMYAPKRQTAGISGTGEGYDAVAYGVVKLVPAVKGNVQRQRGGGVRQRLLVSQTKREQRRPRSSGHES